jgi:hypothetical protein
MTIDEFLFWALTQVSPQGSIVPYIFGGFHFSSVLLLILRVSFKLCYFHFAARLLSLMSLLLNPVITFVTCGQGVVKSAYRWASARKVDGLKIGMKLLLCNKIWVGVIKSVDRWTSDWKPVVLKSSVIFMSGRILTHYRQLVLWCQSNVFSRVLLVQGV